MRLIQPLIAIVATCMFSACKNDHSPPSSNEASEPTTSPVTNHSLEVRLAEGVIPHPYTGRLYLQITPASNGRKVEPIKANRWVNPPIILARDIEKWDGSPISMAVSEMRFPDPFPDLEDGEYRAQAFIRLDPFSADPGRGKGDWISEPLDFSVDEGDLPPLTLTIDSQPEISPPTETERRRWIEIQSAKLSEFHGFDYPMQAGIQLPKNWDPNRSKDFPLLVFIGGFGSDHAGTMRMMDRMGSMMDDIVVITPNARNFRGHSVFVDSASIGPWGTALMTELLPAIDKQFGLAGASKRFVSGLSSGGWSSLWLQVRWPEEFQHVWSYAPDPIDFTDFQRINLYEEGANFYSMRDGNRRPVGRMGDKRLWFDDFIAYEDILGPGGQIHSFEATFSPADENGDPKPLFDRKTGAVDPEVADAFRSFDISAYLKKNWHELSPKLAGKLTVIGGAEDNFYLEGAVRRFAEVTTELGSDADVQVIEGMGHTIHGPTLEQMIETITATKESPDQ